MKTNMTQNLFTVLISSLCILEMLIYPINIRADETFMAYFHKKTGEIFYEEEFKLKSKQFDLNDVEVIYLNVKPCPKRKLKENMSKEELDELIPVREAITCMLVEQMGYKLFKTTEEYSNGGKKSEYTGYGLSKYFIEYKHGKATEWYENGQKKLEANFEFGAAEREGKIWYNNGAIQSKLNFLDGNLHGVVKTYYQNGALLYKDTYKNGEKINRKAYDREGRLKFSQDY